MANIKSTPEPTTETIENQPDEKEAETIQVSWKAWEDIRYLACQLYGL